MKSTDAAMDTHLAGTTTSLVACWKLKRRDGTIFTFTESDQTLSVDIGDGDGALSYVPTSSFSRSAIKSTDDLAVDNLDLVGSLAATDVDEDELRVGLFDYATVWVFLVDHLDLTNGIVAMRKGFIGEVVVTRNGFFQAELRGLTQLFSQNFVELYSIECRADLGDSRCKVPLLPDILGRVQDVALDEVYFVLTESLPAGFTGSLTNITNPSFETDPLGTDGTDPITGWTVFDGSAAAFTITADPSDGSQNLSFVSANDGGIRQDVELRSSMGGDLPDADLTTGDLITVSASYDGKLDSTSDSYSLTLFALDSSDVVIATGITRSGQTLSYAAVDASVLCPAGTAKVRIQIRFEDVGSVDGDADNVTATFQNLGAFADPIPHTTYGDRIYRVTTAGRTAGIQPVYDTDVGDPTTDGTAILEAEESWTRAIEVTAVGADPRKDFTVTELTPNSGGTIEGRDHFPDDAMNGGVVVWQTGDNAGASMEVRDFVADDGITITQDVELFLDMPKDIQVGDDGYIYRGCFKRLLQDCRDVFDNVVNHRGEAYLPGKGKTFVYPDATG